MVPHTILLIEDDPSLGYILKEYLNLNQYDVIWLKDGTEALTHLKKGSFNLCILDVMLPKKDGFTLAAEIRQLFPAQPIIFLTAKSLKVDKLKGFRLGADDYITKPVDEEELVARISAIISRTSKPEILKTHVKIGSFQFDTINMSLVKDREIYVMSNRETDVLKLLSATPGRLVERKKILNELWGANDYFTRRSMDVIISRLRKYLKADPDVAIVTVHSKGYILKVS